MELKLDLLSNAIDSLREALEKYEQGSEQKIRAYKFSVLHLSHFLELLFKYHVSQSHPLLIYKNPFSKNIAKENTITLWDAIQFLKNEGAEFSVDFNKDLEWLKALRNDIEHHTFELDILEVRRTLGRIIRATEEFNEHHGLLDVAKHLGGTHLKIYQELVDEYKASLANARIAAKGLTENGETYDCSGCGELGVGAYIGHEIVCQLCNAIDHLYQCFRCEDRFREDQASSWNDEYDEYICEYCSDHIFNRD
ncbi:hypothetical protein U8L64_09765 [Pseudomonas sp. FIP_A4]|uniref:hypothetical protein n=1 Tax=Pseudomonas sp. FIP_A4 TaxID=3070684 RepID=UPI002FD66D3E